VNATLSLFAECPLPVCGNLVSDPGELCGECERATAGYIRRVPTPPEPDITPGPPPPDLLVTENAESVPEAAEVPEEVRLLLAKHEAGATAAARHAAQDRGEEYKPGQVCWVCEERRLCRKDPEFLGTRDERWICRECEAIPA
jgi:hypothetical protein